MTHLQASAYTAKRLRREFEPESRPWHDEAVETPWEDAEVIIDGIDRPHLRYGGKPIQAQTTFVMKNVFFFSHMTAVQHKAIPIFRCPHSSVIVEAATGSGKTLAFLTPIVERLAFASHGMVISKGRPNLTGAIGAVVLSPSRVLAEQTAVVAKKLCARYPFNISAVLCDEVVEPPKAVVRHLRKQKRGAGVILVTTPEDLVRLMDYIDNPPEEFAHGSDDDDPVEIPEAATRAAGGKRPRDENNKNGIHTATEMFGCVDYIPAYMPVVGGPTAATHKPEIDESEAPTAVEKVTPAAVDVSTAKRLPFMLVVDEADVVLRAPRMRSQVEGFAERLLKETSFDLDIGLYGATVGSSNDAEEFAERFTGVNVRKDASSDVAFKKVGTDESSAISTIHRVVLHSNEDFVSLLQNKFLACPVQDYMHSLVHTINLHPNRKHFIFFNSIEMLLFVKGVLEQLVVKVEGDGVGKGKHHTVAHNESRRAILYISKIYAMHEELSEVAKFNEYNGFLSHGSSGGAHSAAAAGFASAKIVAHKRDLLVAKEAKTHHQSAAVKEAKDPEEHKNPHFMSGWKRDSRPQPGQGAILLCTDEAAFGLDVRDVDYVYHAELPSTPQSYVHRIGRVGRMGMRGTSVLILPVEVSETAAPQSDAATWNANGSYRTIMNSKSVSKGQPTGLSTAEGGLTEEDFADEQRSFFDSLDKARSLERYRLPAVAPLTPAIRAVVQGDGKLIAAGKKAAMKLSGFQAEKQEGSYVWWTPRMALQGLLLAIAK